MQAIPDMFAARRAMVDNQIRTFDVTDQQVLAAFDTVPREAYLPPDLADLAYSDAALTVAAADGGKRTLLAPMVLARMVQALDLVPTDNAMVVASGSGYAAAILAHLCRAVLALETKEMANGRSLPSSETVVTASGALAAGWPAVAPYDAILVPGAVEQNLDALLGQLAPGGRLVAIQTASHEATRRSGKVVRYESIDGEISARVVFDATAPVLEAFRQVPSFVF